jgi:cytidylate kinase
MKSCGNLARRMHLRLLNGSHSTIFQGDAMKSPTHLDARMSAFAEQKMRFWGQLQEHAAHAGHLQDSGQSMGQSLCYVAISREAGAAAATVAKMVASCLNWKVYDANLLDEVAKRNQESRLMLDAVDETASNWAYDFLGTWMASQVIPQDKYVIQVNRLIRTLARAGNAVFMGRGAQFLLPRSKTLAVRIVAPEAFRARRVQERHNVGLQEALDAIHRTDRGRRDFNRRFFHQDIDDPHLFDLVINAAQFGPTEAAEQIVHAVRRAGERYVSPRGSCPFSDTLPPLPSKSGL